MKEEYKKWYSPNLSGEIELLIYGHSGCPVLLFPTSKGRYYETKDFGLIASVQHLIEEGKVKIYCPDSIDAQSWYNQSISPADRAKNHSWYDKMLVEELFPLAVNETGYTKVVTAGCSFGGYHAANFAFRHPALVSRMFSMSGTFDISQQVAGFYDNDVYYNNPVDFLPDDHDPDAGDRRLARPRSRLRHDEWRPGALHRIVLAAHL